MNICEVKLNNQDHPHKIRLDTSLEISSQKENKQMMDKKFKIYIKEQQEVKVQGKSKHSIQEISKPVQEITELSEYNEDKKVHNF